MRLRRSVLAFILVACLTAGCGGPTFLLPGGALDGELAPPPADWSFARDAGTVQIETNPAEPYSVNVAPTVLDGKMYVYAGDSETQWVQHIAANPDVRFRVGETLYELRAERVSDAALVKAFGDDWLGRYRFSTHPAEYEEMWLFELVAR